MNWITIAVLAILVMFGFYGWYKGILRIVLSLAATIITILVTIFASPLIARGIKDNTDLYQKLENVVYKTISKNDNFSDAIDETLPEEKQAEYIDSKGEISTYIENIVNVLNLPQSMSKQVEENVPQETINQFIENGSTTARDMVTHIMADRLTSVIFNTVIYFIIFMVVMAVLRIVMKVTGVIGHLPVIHELNKFGGLVFGLAEGLIVVWLLFMILTLCSSNQWASQALTDIKNNAILEFIYNNNFILKSTFRNI